MIAPKPMDQDIRFCTTTDGVRIAYATVGNGPALVKAANWLNHLEYDWQSPVWRHLLEELASDHFLVRYDERGNGLSDRNVDNLSFETMVQDLESVVDAVGLERFAVLGISQGGAVAIDYTVRHPGRVSHLVLYGAYARGWAVRGADATADERRALITLARQGWGQDNPAFRQVFTTLYVPDATSEQMRWFNDLQRLTTSPENAARLMTTFGEIDVSHLLPQVGVPTLVLHCREESVVPFEEGRRLAAAIPGARFVALQGRNHLLLEHEPAWLHFLREVRRFLNATPHASWEQPDRVQSGEQARASNPGTALTTGTHLGRYEITGALGTGGMGEVYQARDTSLDREVAIKVLPDAFAADRERLARFEREARLLAALDHPHIAAVHSLEEQQGKRLLVLELVRGETLAERLRRGPLATAEALRLCAQVAQGLEAAHLKGIVHRDLKPSNVRLTLEGNAKVLDFGLAKALDHRPPFDSSAATRSQFETVAHTVLGTPAYMSPEQARGLPVDRRTDIWSFGCLLYEGLTGRRAFEGPTAFDTLAAILGHEPDWRAVPASVPATVVALLHRCLQKDPERRLRDLGDARLELEEALAGLPGRPGRVPRPVAAGLVALALVAAVGLTVVRLTAPGRRGATTGQEAAARPPALRLAQVTSAAGLEEFPAWAPDGTRLAYAVESGGVRKIVLRRLDTGEETPLTTGPHDDIQAAWSPGGSSMLFVRAQQPGVKLEPGDIFGTYTGGDVWAIDLASRRETRLIREAFNPSFSPDGRHIAVDAPWAGTRRIWVTDDQGRNPQQVTADASEAVDHTTPRWSPDGRAIVFQNGERTKLDVRVVEVDSRRMTWLTNDLFLDVSPAWSPSGRFIYFSSHRSGGLNVWRLPVDRNGAAAGPPQQLTTGAGQDVELALSADGRRLAFSVLRQNADLWRLPVAPDAGKARGAPLQVLAGTREESRASWSPDGRQIAFNSDRAGDMNIWVLSLADGSVRQATRGAGGDYQPSWSPDGRTLVFFSNRNGNADIWAVGVAGGEPRALTRSSALEINPVFSPDGRHIAYQSDDGGRLEVWVMREDGTSPRRLTETGVMGHFLRFSPRGDAVIYRCPCEGRPEVMRVALGGGPPERLPEVAGGSHLSFSPGFATVMDVVGHKTLWASPLAGGRPHRVFEFPDPAVRIDYPVWSPDGRWVLFDRFQPQGGDVWTLEGLE